MSVVIKRLLLSRCRLSAVPGSEGVQVARMIGGEGLAGRTVLLPNIVDESLFREMGRASEQSADPRIALWPARLIPNKGIVEFLSCLERKDLDGWQIRIIGEGPLKSDIARVLSERDLHGPVELLPYQPYQDMPKFYRGASVFLLPSIHDPNPLSVVEALHSGLPLLLSNRVGNFREALLDGQNGIGFDPLRPSAVRTAIRTMFRLPPERLRAMGEVSRKVGALSWNSRDVVRNFIAELGFERMPARVEV